MDLEGTQAWTLAVHARELRDPKAVRSVRLLPAFDQYVIGASYHAERLFSSRALWRLGRDQGIYAPLPSPEEAAAYPYTDADQARIAKVREQAIFGTPAEVGAKLRAIAEANEVEEIAVLTTVHDPDARRRSYALLAREFGLKPVDVAPAGG